jgi:hypothetical protein
VRGLLALIICGEHHMVRQNKCAKSSYEAANAIIGTPPLLSYWILIISLTKGLPPNTISIGIWGVSKIRTFERHIETKADTDGLIADLGSGSMERKLIFGLCA